MPKAESIDRETRERLRLHLLWLMDEHRTNAQRLSKKLGISPSTISSILSGDRTMGFDVFIKLHRVLGVSANYLLDSPPPSSSPPPARRPLDAVSRTDPGIQRPVRRHGSGR